MTDYTLTIDPSMVIVTLSNVNLYASWILRVEGIPNVVVTLTPFRDYCHEWFYAMDCNLESTGSKTIYRIGATISNTIPIADPVMEPFVAIQCLVFAEDVSADKKFRIST
jgi:hypothetical protein